MMDEKNAIPMRDDDDDCSETSSRGLHSADMQRERESKEQTPIANRETTTVFRLKVLVCVVMIASAIAAAFSVWHYSSQTELDKFEAQFVDDANKVLDAMAGNLVSTLNAFDTLATTMVAHGVSSNSIWPFVTLPNFGLLVAKILPLSKAMFISVLPIVQPEEREQWEAYATQNDNWVNESISWQETWDGYYGPDIHDWVANPVIHFMEDLPYTKNRNYLPAWQTFPSIPIYSPYNYDYLGESNPESFNHCLSSHRAVLSGTYLLPTANAIAQEEEATWADFFSTYISPNENPLEPVVDFHYPIINDIGKINVAGADDYDPSKHEIVGLLAASIYWRELIRGNVPTETSKLLIVFTSPCSDPFTYQISGPDVLYLGVGDRHNQIYDELVICKNIAEKLSSHASKSNSQYSGAPLDSDYCPVTLCVYPSDEMKDSFITQGPFILSAGALAIFAFTSLIFFLYDYSVERRQHVVLHTATRSSEIVSSLFPTTVQDRLYSSTTDGKSDGGKNKLQSFVKSSDNHTTNNKLTGPPIAELYPETTVFFADISGFTSWSANRQPTEVFHLLETLYGAFDGFAVTHGVFKVETIGDSYVAVVGLPSPRKNHAVVMAKFAHECLVAMDSLTNDLESTLGPGTRELSLRVGLNSGPTTAGVLRGAKARFQLFGATVNTAARMESNGEPNRIQVSQETADRIVASGKGHWLTARSDKVHAKGKGEMQTYWCNPTTSQSPQKEESDAFVSI